MNPLNSTSGNLEFYSPLNLTDLCDDVLLHIFSYLDLFDGTIVIRQTCKRFHNLMCMHNFPVKSIKSNEFQTSKWPSKTNLKFDKVFERVGEQLKKFTFNSIKKDFKFNVMLKSLGECCHNLSTLEITALLNVSNVKLLPKSLKFLTITFAGRSLDIRFLTHLETLNLTSSHYILNNIKVQHALKEFRLNLDYLMTDLPDADKINKLTSISEKSVVVLQLSYNLQQKLLDCKIFLVKILNLRDIEIANFFRIQEDNISVYDMIRVVMNIFCSV